MEIERKFLVKEMPGDLSVYEKKEIEQGYLNRNPVLRIRRSNDKYILTYKMKVEAKGKSSAPCVNEEIEAALTKEAYMHLRTKTDNNMIEKTRYIIPYSNRGKEYKIELDVFHGCLEGLVFAEVEFPGLEEADDFVGPDWFGEDVSDDRRYRNGFLSEQTGLDAFRI